MSTKILIVDDEPDFEMLILQIYRRKLRSGEIDPVFAANGVQALEKLREDDQIGMVFSDINMPEMDGLTLLGEIQKLHPEIPVVIVSAYGDMANIRTAMNRGAFDFLTKPIDFKDLETTRQKAILRVEEVEKSRLVNDERLKLEEHNAHIRDIFGRYVDDIVVQTLLDSPEGLSLGGEKRTCTVLMSDLRGFTTMVERHAPAVIVSTMNHYLSRMIDIIMEHGGYVAEILGDAVLAIFGAPVVHGDHSTRAAACAIAMQLAMEEINEHNEEAGFPALEMGIGLNTGDLVVGNIGSVRRAKYGVVGRPINIAARIESTTLGGEIAMSESTYLDAGDILEVGVKSEFVAKGIDEPITIYELRGVGGTYDQRLPERSNDRVPLDVPLDVRFGAITGGVVEPVRLRGTLTELAMTAAVLQTDETLEARQSIKLHIAVGEDESAHTLYAKVAAQSDDGRYGIAFTFLGSESKPFLKRLISGEPPPAQAAPPAPDAEAAKPAGASGAIEVAAGMAHEIRNPLNFVSSFSRLSEQLLMELREELVGLGACLEKDSAEQLLETVDLVTDNAAKIQAHSARAESIITSMLERAKGLAAAREPADLHVLLDEQLVLAHDSAKLRNSALEVEIVKDYMDAPPTLQIDRLSVARSILILFNNAFDSMAERCADEGTDFQPRIVISTGTHPDGVEIRIRDNGRGITEENLPRIFAPRFSTKHEARGVGLGLSLSHDVIVSQHHGGLYAESTEGEFAEFVIVLPVE